MPWHAVQFLRMTSHTGPSGRTTCGRMGFLDCAAPGVADSAITTASVLKNVHFIGISPCLTPSALLLQTPGRCALYEHRPGDSSLDSRRLLGESWERSGARTETLLIEAVQMQD